jgi:hypothetical protein
MTVVNSMKTTQGAHEQGVYMMHTSYQMRSTLRHPSLGSWTSKILGPRLDSLPASVLIHGPSNLANSGYFDPIYAPLRIPEASKGLPDLGNPKIIAQTESNLTRLDRFNRRFLEKFKHDKLQAYEEMYDHALALMKGSHVDVFDIHKEKDVVKERYGHHQIGEGCLLARRLVEKGVRHVEVVERGWDTHQDNFGKLSGKLPQVDQAVSALLVDLEQRGLLDDTLVVLATEFGRSPKINDRELGRDHHPSAYSTLLAGGGIRGGVVYGQTDERGHDVVEKPVRPQDLNATIAHALGLPTERRIFNADGRPFRVAHDGEVKSEWFS